MTDDHTVRDYRVRRQVTSKAVRWNGSNLPALQSLVHPPYTLVAAERGYLLLKEPGRLDRPIELGMWLRLATPGGLFTASDCSFRHLFEEDTDD